MRNTRQPFVGPGVRRSTSQDRPCAARTHVTQQSGWTLLPILCYIGHLQIGFDHVVAPKTGVRDHDFKVQGMKLEKMAGLNALHELNPALESSSSRCPTDPSS